MIEFFSYIALGAGTGILAGLLGIGGGIVIVPALIFLFSMQGMAPDYVQHLALGTSMASILFTSLSSLRSHHAHGAVDWAIVKRITPGILIGTLLGAWLASKLSSEILKMIFIGFVYFVAAQMLFNIKPKPSRALPQSSGMLMSGGVIGVFSSFVGIGGGTLLVPFMTNCNVPLRRVIGTSAAIGFPIALAGSIGFIASGFGNAALPRLSIGFIYLPALLGIALVSMMTAPIGARLAHALPVSRLKKMFALLLIAVGTKMLLSLL
ncbi:sulfite exporter TauE/SafE family protein [Collimonas antrihumi]|uniref:sulfite exporter TauE/SafE family protein n=1 Tax=Collimonas antrihumi TaxID=1940615 RepID=UPI001B8CEE84|nr:sulfite exporter TauE/SafE family protein [Collimonas antrihumi]